MSTTTGNTLARGRALNLSKAQFALVERAYAAGGAVHVIGDAVRTARSLEARKLGTLRDDGGIGLRDGERWTFTLAETHRAIATVNESRARAGAGPLPSTGSSPLPSLAPIAPRANRDAAWQRETAVAPEHWRLLDWATKLDLFEAAWDLAALAHAGGCDDHAGTAAKLLEVINECRARAGAGPLPVAEECGHVPGRLCHRCAATLTGVQS